MTGPTENPDFSREVVDVVEVTVAPDVCVVIPSGDLRDRRAFAVWSRFYRPDGIFLNHGWQQAARTLFGDEIERARSGDRGAAAALAVTLPSALDFPEVRTALIDALWAFDVESLSALVTDLRKQRKHSPLNRRLGIEGERAYRAVTGWRGRHLDSTASLDPRVPIEELAGDRVTDRERAAAMMKAWKAAIARTRRFPRVVEGELSEHAHRRHPFVPTTVPREKAPQIIWNKEQIKREGLKPDAGIAVWPLPWPLGGGLEPTPAGPRQTRGGPVLRSGNDEE